MNNYGHDLAMESPFANAPGSGENQRTQKKPIRETTGRACTETLYKPYPHYLDQTRDPETARIRR